VNESALTDKSSKHHGPWLPSHLVIVSVSGIVKLEHAGPHA